MYEGCLVSRKPVNISSLVCELQQELENTKRFEWLIDIIDCCLNEGVRQPRILVFIIEAFECFKIII
ncbi:hypothetical protein SDJN02_09280, partial [Cucurbita argyrosperma subsp. argyrosperma]